MNVIKKYRNHTISIQEQRILGTYSLWNFRFNTKITDYTKKYVIVQLNNDNDLHITNMYVQARHLNTCPIR